MEAMRTAYSNSGIQSQHVSNYTRKTITEGTRALFANNIYSISLNRFDDGKGAFEMRHSYCISSVRISEFLYANLLSTCIRCMHPLKS